MICSEIGGRFDLTSLPTLRDFLSRAFLASVPASGDKLWSDILKVARGFPHDQYAKYHGGPYQPE